MDAIEQDILRTLDARRTELIAFSRELAEHAEPGFRENFTAARVADWLRGCGLSPRTGLASTGVKASLTGAQEGPNAAVIGELDGIACPAHPQANPVTGMAHACGHNLQLTALAGAALALSAPSVREALCGTVTFFAVPAEEYVPLSARRRLRAERDIRFCCGKSELVRRGEFDDVDLALTTHVFMTPCEGDLLLGNPACNGFVGKSVRIRGRAAHAANAPHDGVNAVNAAALSLSALGLLRETFREEDTVRIHTNILSGGEAINVVPALCELEGQVRACNLEALRETSAAFDRVFTHSAAALGATAEILTTQGYLPVRPAPAHPASLAAAALLPYRAVPVPPGLHNLASTDVGDLTQLLPVVNFTHGGTRGGLHSADFCVTDEELACIVPAKMMALTAYHLLRQNAAQARRTLAEFKPAMTRAEYIRQIEEAYEFGTDGTGA